MINDIKRCLNAYTNDGELFKGKLVDCDFYNHRTCILKNITRIVDPEEIKTITFIKTDLGDHALVVCEYRTLYLKIENYSILTEEIIK